VNFRSWDERLSSRASRSEISEETGRAVSGKPIRRGDSFLGYSSDTHVNEDAVRPFRTRVRFPASPLRARRKANMTGPVGQVPAGSRVAIYSKFPARFMESKILPKLRRRDMEIAFVEAPKKALPSQLSNVDYVLLMTEMGSHAETAVVKKACELAKKPIRALSRKEASWDVLPAERWEEPEVAESQVFALTTVTVPSEKVVGMMIQQSEYETALKANDSSSIEKLYEEENAELRKKLAASSERVEELSKKLKSTQTMLYEARNRKTGSDAKLGKLSDLVSAGRAAIKAGLMSQDEVAKKLAEVLLSNGV
jgi:hypothetical protein